MLPGLALELDTKTSVYNPTDYMQFIVIYKHIQIQKQE